MEIVVAFFLGIIALVMLRWFKRPIKRSAYVADYNLSSAYASSMARATRKSNKIYNDLVRDFPDFKTSHEVFDLITKRNKE